MSIPNSPLNTLKTQFFDNLPEGFDTEALEMHAKKFASKGIKKFPCPVNKVQKKDKQQDGSFEKAAKLAVQTPQSLI